MSKGLADNSSGRLRLKVHMIKKNSGVSIKRKALAIFKIEWMGIRVVFEHAVQILTKIN